MGVTPETWGETMSQEALGARRRMLLGAGGEGGTAVKEHLGSNTSRTWGLWLDRDGDGREVLSFLICQSNLGMKKGPGIRTWWTERRAGPAVPQD